MLATIEQGKAYCKEKKYTEEHEGLFFLGMICAYVDEYLPKSLYNKKGTYFQAKAIESSASQSMQGYTERDLETFYASVLEDGKKYLLPNVFTGMARLANIGEHLQERKIPYNEALLYVSAGNAVAKQPFISGAYKAMGDLRE